MKNARFFDEHQDKNRPCYAHICYPQNEEPYYFWEERFQVDKCCQYKGQKISEAIFKLADRMRSMRTNGASKNREK